VPYRLFNLDEVAAYLHLPARDVATLVKRNEIPFERQGERAVFRKREIDAWASQRILRLSGAGLADYHRSSAKFRDLSLRKAIIAELMAEDRIDPALSSRTRASVVRDMVALADQTSLVSDAKDLLRSLEGREQLCSTGLPGGVALLHARQHDPYMFADSFVALGRAIQPIHFGATDGQPTDLFFLICCQDDRTHLHTLARLCAMIQQTQVLLALRAADDSAAMLQIIVSTEGEVIRRL
jgi:nitrogen PTS system EIIA component